MIWMSLIIFLLIIAVFALSKALKTELDKTENYVSRIDSLIDQLNSTRRELGNLKSSIARKEAKSKNRSKRPKGPEINKFGMHV